VVGITVGEGDGRSTHVLARLANLRPEDRVGRRIEGGGRVGKTAGDGGIAAASALGIGRHGISRSAGSRGRTRSAARSALRRRSARPSGRLSDQHAARRAAVWCSRDNGGALQQADDRGSRYLGDSMILHWRTTARRPPAILAEAAGRRAIAWMSAPVPARGSPDRRVMADLVEDGRRENSSREG